jgi:hypothetical protein
MHSENFRAWLFDPCPDDPDGGPWAMAGGSSFRHAVAAAFATAALTLGGALAPFWMMNWPWLLGSG